MYYTDYFSEEYMNQHVFPLHHKKNDTKYIWLDLKK